MKILDIIKQEKIYGIIRQDDINLALMIARAYIEGGLRVIELNCPIEVTRELSQKYNDIIFAQGGIVTTQQAQQAISNGAKIISSPIFQGNLVRFCACNKTFLIPSTTTPNEAYSAWKSRMALIKIYPVNELGGYEYIKDITKPMPFLNLLPCGFVKLNEIKKYLSAKATAVGIGRELYDKKDFEEIKKTVMHVKDTVRN